MLSDSNSSEIQSQKGLEIKHDDKFFTRLMSKETSMASSSCRVYYGGASVAVLFMWESQPGTPKHPSSHTALPPLTPPPSYHSSFKSKSMKKKGMKSTLFSSIYNAPMKNHATSPSSSRSSTSSLSSSLSSWSTPSANFYSVKRNLFHRRKSHFWCSRSPVHNFVDDDDDDDDAERLGSPTSTLCFGVKPRNLNEKSIAINC